MSDGLVRVMFELDGNTTERLWAEPVGAGRYRLRNTPFFAFGVSTEDIVFAEERGGLLRFTGVSIRAGHSTYRLKRTGHCGDELWQARWEPLARLGCTYESGTVLAVDVPPSATMRREAAAAWASQCWPAERGGGRLSVRRRGASAASSHDRLTHAAYDRLREHAADARAARGRPHDRRHE
jgi:Domain of unknown function (DUF4265)